LAGNLHVRTPSQRTLIVREPPIVRFGE
jgi:hypothetical protein